MAENLVNCTQCQTQELKPKKIGGKYDEIKSTKWTLFTIWAIKDDLFGIKGYAMLGLPEPGESLIFVKPKKRENLII